MSQAIFVLHSPLAPNAVADDLRRSIDEKHWTLFSLAGYRGNLPLIGDVGENTFRLQKRKFSRNDFAGHLYARFEPEPGGTRIEAYFDAPRWARYFMRIWLAFAVLIGTPIFVETVIDLVRGGHYTSGDQWVGLVGPPGLVLVGAVLPRVGRLLGKADERFMLEHVQNTLAAHVEEPYQRA
jgi:hypothetical protein